MSNAIRWTTAQIDEYVKRRLARHGTALAAVDSMIAEVTEIQTPPMGNRSKYGNIPTDGEASRRGKPIVAGTRLRPLIQLCIAHGLPEPRPEYRFHPTRLWRFDYAWPAQKIAAEVEGGIWRKGGGAHSHPQNIERDIEKYNAAAVLGWRVLRVVPEKMSELMPLLCEVLK